MKDIESRSDLEFLLGEFYKLAPNDELIGHHFNDINLIAHLPVIVDFWEKILFGRHVYFGNPMQIHQIIHAKFPLELEHFRRWVEIFTATVDKYFVGEMAQNTKLRARMIAHSLNQKLNGTTVSISKAV